MAMTDQARLAMLALPKYISKKMEVPTRKSYLLQEIQKRGRMSTNNGGRNIEWRPEIRKHDLTWGPGNPNVISFPQVNLHTKATLDYKTAFMGASRSEIELLALMDRPTRFFKDIKSIGDSLSSDFPVRFAPQLFRDGVGTQKLDGFESWGGHDSTEISNEPIGNPSDTYAGLSTALGGLGGDWSAPSGGNWPRSGDDPNSCDFEYSAFSPMLVNYNSSHLVQDSSTEDEGWDDCWVYACRYLMTYQGILTSSAPDVLIIDPDLLRRAENSLKKDQQFQLDSVGKDLDAGVRVMQFEGIRFATEFGVPAGCVYGVKFNELELRCMGPNFISTDEEKDFVTGDTLYKLSWHGNLWVSSPVHFPMIKGVTSLGT